MKWYDSIFKGMFCEVISQKLDCISWTGATAPHNLSSLEPKKQVSYEEKLYSAAIFLTVWQTADQWAAGGIAPWLIVASKNKDKH